MVQQSLGFSPCYGASCTQCLFHGFSQQCTVFYHQDVKKSPGAKALISPILYGPTKVVP
jgi:activator of 2-hydroxyglutaryl-CoA dehydratase